MTLDRQFRVLYRQFLFRMVDLELLSADAQGDMNKLFGQFAALLVFISLFLSLAGMIAGVGNRIVEWYSLHFLIDTTMLVVGLFAVLSWDSTFPDRSDVMVLAPLPVRTRTVFLAKITAVATALSVTVATLHIFSGFVLPLSLNASGSIFGFLRVFVAWWITMLAGGVFIFCCVLSVQGLAAQLLPRRYFLRVSSFLQMAAFALFVGNYFLVTETTWSPSWWFTGLFEDLRGAAAPVDMAWRAWFSLGIAVTCTAVVYTLAYFRTMRKIVEEPDIAPIVRGGTCLPRLGDGFGTAIGQFSFRTTLRSRQHRLLLAFYGGLGFASAILFPRSPVMRDLAQEGGPRLPMTAATILIVILCITGTRVVFSMPMDMRANWIFRIAPFPDGRACMTVRRRVLYALAVAPVWTGCAVLLFSTWPRAEAAKHLAVLLLAGAITVELCLRGSQKLPFTCSYLPGKSNFNMTFLLCSGFVFAALGGLAKLERSLFDNALAYGGLLAGLLAFVIVLWWSSPQEALQFEESAEPAVFVLNLQRDYFST